MASSRIRRCDRGSGTASQRDGDCKVACPCRAVFRDFVGSRMRYRNHYELSDKLYPPSLVAADLRLLSECGALGKMRDLVDQINTKDGPELDELCNRLAFPENPTEVNVAIAKMSELLLGKTSSSRWGRLLALIVFAACVACKCADRGHEYVRIVLEHFEDDVDERLHKWIEKTEEEAAVVSEVEDLPLKKPSSLKLRHIGLAALFVAGIAVVTSLGPSKA